VRRDDPVLLGAALFAVIAVLGAATLGFGQRSVAYVPSPDPGHEESATGWWCYSGGAIPDPHRPEVEGGRVDRPCSEEFLTFWCARYLPVASRPPEPYCKP